MRNYFELHFATLAGEDPGFPGEGTTPHKGSPTLYFDIFLPKKAPFKSKKFGFVGKGDTRDANPANDRVHEALQFGNALKSMRGLTPRLNEAC